MDSESFTRFAQDAGLALPFLRRRMAALGARIQAVIAEGPALPGLVDRVFPCDLASIVSDRAARATLKARP